MGRSLDPFSDDGKVVCARLTTQLLQRGTALQEHLDDDLSHRVGVPPNQIDFVIRQTVSLVAQQLPTALDRDCVGSNVYVVRMLHGSPLRSTPAVACARSEEHTSE